MKAATATHDASPPTAREALTHFQRTALAQARECMAKADQGVALVYAEIKTREDALKAAPAPSPDAGQVAFIRQRDNVDYLRQRLAIAQQDAAAANDAHRVAAQALREAEAQAASLRHEVLLDEARRIEAELGALASQATTKLAQFDAIGAHFRKAGVVGRPIETFGAPRNRVSGFWIGATVSQAEDRAATEQIADLLRNLED